MSSYALYRGLGQAANQAAQDIGEQLKAERLAKLQKNQSDDDQSRKLGIIDIENQNQTTRDKANFEKDKELLTLKSDLDAKNAKNGVSGKGATANERAVSAMVRSGYVADESEGWDIIYGSGKNRAADALELAKMISLDQENKGITPESEEYKSASEIFAEAMGQLGKKIQKEDKANPWDVETGIPIDEIIIPSHPTLGDISEGDIRESMRKNKKTRDQVLSDIAKMGASSPAKDNTYLSSGVSGSVNRTGVK